MDLNKAMIIGNITRDPEARTTPTGQLVVHFGVATNFTWTDQTGQRKEQAEFHNVVAWRKLAEICQQYLKKGSKVYIEGRLQTHSWDDQTSGQKRYRTEIVAEDMIMLDRAGTTARQTNEQQQESSPLQQPSQPLPSQPAPMPIISVDEEINVEDIPF